MSDAEPVTRNKKQRAQSEPTLIGELDTGGDILKHLVSKHHHHLAGCVIKLLCTNKEIKSGGRSRPGKVQKTTPLVRFLTRDEYGNNEADFLITVSLPMWNEADNHKRTAILDHLLTSIEAAEDETTGEMKYKIVGPQIAEFAEVVERNGAYNPDLQDMKNVLQHAENT
jgi:hypothetical protein